MKLIKLNFFLFALLFSVLSGCDVAKGKEDNAGTKAPVIYQKSFDGFSPGDKIADHKDKIEKDVLQTGEGDFDIFNILNKKLGSLAYFLPDPVDETLVGMIAITSPLPKTEDGFKVGDTFGDLVRKYGEVEVHGSEIESRTHAIVGNLSFQLDEPHATYELDMDAVSKSAKIVEIIINR